MLGYWFRRRLAWPLHSEDLEVTGGDGVRLLLRATWQPGPRAAAPALLLLHGMGGSDASSYVLATGQHAYARGWHVVRMNMRGSGDALELDARLYNAGLDGDVVAALQAVAREAPRQAAVGFSLGASLVLLALGRSARLLPPGLGGAVAISPPLDLAACAAALERPVNRGYQWYFMRGLRAGYDARQRRRPDLYAAGRADRARTVREFDERVTAPYGGYGGAGDYYARSSAGPHLGAVAVPTLLLAAEDDPMIPCASVSCWPLPAGGQVRRELYPTGGHVGFVAAAAGVPGGLWAARRALDFLEQEALAPARRRAG
jgi:predicted alpha/beta-fold hydrolase